MLHRVRSLRAGTRPLTLLLAFAACTRTQPDLSTQDHRPPESKATLIQVSYLEQLRTHRPDLLAMPGSGGVSDPAWQALVLRPRYRARLLSGHLRSYEELLKLEYSESLRERDEAWAANLRASHAGFVPEASLRRAGLSPRAYVGFRIGPDSWTWDRFSFTPKILLELRSFERSLTYERYLDFNRTLAAAGFHGATKVDIRPGQVRFQYNNVIIHAPAVGMALCAEYVALRFFGSELEHVSRGVDPPERVGVQPEDWHHYLLNGGYPSLPTGLRRFVDFEDDAAGECVTPPP